ncbi:MAG: PAS domain S-box protein [Deltaproteobacteria bacterium]|jgi:PAS domain S-box-containing protein|nr:PAS domain S-box protein [Deltaproteobacteria bacterium]
METKPTYKKLEQKIKALKNEAIERKRAEAGLRNAHSELGPHAADQNAELAKTVRRLKGEIKARDRAERKLKESDKKHLNLLNISLVGIYQSSIKGNVLYVNEALATIFGFESPEEMLLESVIVRYKHAEDREVLIRSLKASGSLESFEFEALTKSGETKNILLSAVLEKDTISGMIMDITHRKKAETALRESEERYRSLFKNNHSVMLLIDPGSADIVDANPAAVSFYGWSIEVLTGKKITDINTLSDEQVFQEMGKAKTEQRRVFYFRHLLANGEIRDVEVFSGPIKVHGRELLYSIIHDITERKQVELALLERGKELENKTHELQEVNAALKVLLKHRDEDKKELEEKVIANVKKLVFPYIEKLNNSRLNDRQMIYLNIIKSNLEDIIAPFLHQLFAKFSDLTPSEIQVAGLVRDGKTTKEIAELLNSSTGAINFHRNNIRAKLGLRNTKTNLRSFLLPLA